MNDKDFKIEYTRGTGPGGQHKNKTETCVTITHIPTGLKERCQDTRYKKQNLKIAKFRLVNKIDEYENGLIQEKKNEQRVDRIHNGKIIRTYNFTRNEVYDHRSKVKADLKKMMGGNLDILESHSMGA